MLMDAIWEKANQVSEVGYKIHSAAMIVELVAERLTDNAESGALWAAAEILKQYSEQLEELSSDLMGINRVLEKKGKKK
jgi:hypothetical protein